MEYSILTVEQRVFLAKFAKVLLKVKNDTLVDRIETKSDIEIVYENW